ncbi:MAG: hypothetical protein V1689_12960, partial [Pseudomonadota bacterium]
LFSKGRNPNSSQPVARPLTFKYPDVIGTQAGERKKDPRGPLPFFQNAKVLHLKHNLTKFYNSSQTKRFHQDIRQVVIIDIQTQIV